MVANANSLTIASTGAREADFIVLTVFGARPVTRSVRLSLIKVCPCQNSGQGVQYAIRAGRESPPFPHNYFFGAEFTSTLAVVSVVPITR